MSLNTLSPVILLKVLMGIKQQKGTISWLKQDMFLEKSENQMGFWRTGITENLGKYNRSWHRNQVSIQHQMLLTRFHHRGLGTPTISSHFSITCSAVNKPTERSNWAMSKGSLNTLTVHLPGCIQWGRYLENKVFSEIVWKSLGEALGLCIPEPQLFTILLLVLAKCYNYFIRG